MRVDKRLLSMQFDRGAAVYDEHTPVQARMGRRLLARLDHAGLNPRRIVELGCGTGRLTVALRRRWPSAALTALDLAPAMIARARQRPELDDVQFRVADGELAWQSPDLAAADLVIGNAVAQWFAAPEAALRGWRGRLAPGGRLALSTFGPGTFAELREAFLAAEAAEGVAHREHLVPQASLEDWRRWAGPDLQCHRECHRLHYPDVRSFLHGIQRIGAARAGHGGPLRKAVYRRLLADYPRAAAGVPVTYEVFYLLLPAAS